MELYMTMIRHIILALIIAMLAGGGNVAQDSAFASLFQNVGSASPSETDPRPIEKNDFVVTDGESVIALDAPFAALDIGIEENETGSNYVGEIFEGDLAYKIYSHEYADLILFTSNLKYDQKNREFDYYYISQIALKTPAFHTGRGISIGSDVEDLIKKYGAGAQSALADATMIEYSIDDWIIVFVAENDRIVGIILYVSP